jgi:hypothetical protein
LQQQHQAQNDQGRQGRYHLRSQSVNQAQYLTQRPRQVYGIEAELNMQLEEVEQDILKKTIQSRTLKNQ